MNRRLTYWSLAGFVVACGWVLFMAVIPKTFVLGNALRNLIVVTAPAALLGRFPLKYYWFVLLNAAAYYMVGLAIETLRRSLAHQSSSPPTA